MKLWYCCAGIPYNRCVLLNIAALTTVDVLCSKCCFARIMYTGSKSLNEGWCEFQNVDGYGTYDTLFNVFGSDFKALIDNVCSKPVTRFRANDGDTSAVIDEPQFRPTFYFTHELEYDVDQFSMSKKRYKCTTEDNTDETSDNVTTLNECLCYVGDTSVVYRKPSSPLSSE